MEKHLRDKEIQPKRTMAFLGPKGTFTDIAAKKTLKDCKEDTYLLEATDIDQVFSMVEERIADEGIVPIYNSTDGAVEDTLRNLANFRGTFVGEATIPVSHTIYYQSAWLVQRIASKDTALRQCRNHIEAMFPARTLVSEKSTGLAVQKAAEDPTTAAIGTDIIADVHGLTHKFWKVSRFEDNPLNTTGFVRISRSREIHNDPGNNKTTLLVHMKDEPGSLHNCLHVFSENKINLTQIKSFLRDDHGVSFLISIDGGSHEENVKKALSDLYTYADYRVLGSYVKAEPELECPEDQADINQIAERLKETVNGKDHDLNGSILVFTLKDEVGSLENVLSIFAKRRINLSQIDSLPTGRMGEYAFYLAFKNGLPEHQKLLDEVKKACKELVQIA